MFTLATIEEKNKRKMCDQEVNQPLSPSRSPSNPPQFQLHPSTPGPEKIPSPHIQKRMQGDTCFKCHQQGHWSWFCPLNSPNNKPLSSSSHSPTHHSPQNIHCRCGYGFCIIKTSNSERNPDRKYYSCPIKRGAQCKGYGFMKWCDEPVDQSDLQPPLFKYPQCQCGAGVCRRVRGTEQSTNAVKYYFECPVKKGHGSCGYQVLEDEVLNNTSIAPVRQSMSEDLVLNNTSITPIRKSRQRSLDEFYQNVKSYKIENGLGKGGNFLGQTKRIRIMDNYEFLSSLVISEIPEGEDAGAQSHKNSQQPPQEQKGSTPETSTHSSSHHPFPSYNPSLKQTTPA